MNLEYQAFDKLCQIIKQDYLHIVEFYDKDIKAYPEPLELATDSFENLISDCLIDIFSEGAPKNSFVELRNFLQTKKVNYKRRISRDKVKLAGNIKSEDAKTLNYLNLFFKQNALLPNVLKGSTGYTNKADYLADLKVKTDNWEKEDLSMLKNPLIDFCGANKIKWFLDELYFIIVSLLLDNNLSLLNFSKPHAESLVEKPMFSPQSKRINSKDLVMDNDSNAIYQISEEFAMIIKDSQNEILKLLDTKDFEILSKLLSFLTEDLTARYTGKVEFDEIEIAKILANNNRPSNLHYKRAEERLYYLRKIDFYDYDAQSNQTKMYRLINDVIIDHNTKRVQVFFGDTIMDNVINKQLIYIPNDVLALLTYPASSKLAPILQKERIRLYMEDNTMSNFTQVYNYSFFSNKFLFTSKSSKKNWNIIKDSLCEFVDNDIIVKEYHMNRDSTLAITFIPFTESEIKDLLRYFKRGESVANLLPVDVKNTAL